MKVVRYDEYRKEQIQDPEFKTEYDALEDEFKLAVEVIELRKKNNLTQKELADRVGTSQPAIARLESGNYRNLSLAFLRRVAIALNAVPEIHLRNRET
jgi:DNA-binding XRE family transcriptional regulator